MRRSIRFIGGFVFVVPCGSLCAQSPTLSVDDLTLAGGQTGQIVVSGSVNDELTYGVTIIVEIHSREGNQGSVVFTPSPPVDIKQLGDPWPGSGTFNRFDTDEPGFSDVLNGTAKDDGRYICDQSVSFAGPLSGFPVVASIDALGVWDVSLSISDFDSNWECVPTTRMGGTITVTPPVPAVSTWGLVALALAVLSAGSLMLRQCIGARGSS